MADGERTRAVNKVRAGLKDRQDKQNRLAAGPQFATRQGLGTVLQSLLEELGPEQVFTPSADISGGIARLADPNDDPRLGAPMPAAPEYRPVEPERGFERVFRRRYGR